MANYLHADNGIEGNTRKGIINLEYLTPLKDVNLFNPKFIRIVLPGGYDYYFDYVDGVYVGRKDKIELTEFLKDKTEYEHHISVLSVDNKRALLVYESDINQDIIIRLSGIVKQKELNFILKQSGNRSLHLLIPIICANEIEYTKLWDSIFYILSEEDRNAIDLNLRNYSAKIRGIDSLHLKTYDTSNILPGYSGKIEYLGLEYCEANRKKFNAVPSVDINGVITSGERKKKFELIKSVGERSDRIIEVVRGLVEGERGVCLTYLACKLEDNENNRKFLRLCASAVKDRANFDLEDEYNKIVASIGKGYGKKIIKNAPSSAKLINALFGYLAPLKIRKGLSKGWCEYEASINESVDLAKDPEERAKYKEKLNELQGAKKFLEERGFIEWIPDAINGIQIYKSLKLMEETAGLRISKDNYNVAGLGIKNEVMIKAKESEKGLEALKQILEAKINENKEKFNQNDFIPKIPQECNKEYGEIAFLNKGSKKFTKIIYDIETGDKQEAVLICCYNKELKRIILGEIVKHKQGETELDKDDPSKLKYRFVKNYVNDFEVIRVQIRNGYEALFLADSEGYLASNINSLMRQGDSTPTILQDLIKNVDINYNYVNEILNNKRRSLYVAHNSNFDINKLNTTTNEKLVHISSSGIKKIELDVTGFGNKTKYNAYTWKPKQILGNRESGVYFKAGTRKYGLWQKPEIELRPVQQESDNYAYACDTLLLASTLQKKGKSLKALGEEFKLNVVKGESAYKFTGKEIWSNEEKDIKEIEYLLKDVFVTDYVLCELTRELDVIKDILHIAGIPDNRIKNHAKEDPYLYRIYSTASISKILYQFMYSEDYDDWRVRQSNIKFYDSINDLFFNVYSGGRVEVFKRGLINKKCSYLDFSSLYPHTSYLTNVEVLMKDTLDKKLIFTSNVQQIRGEFWSSVQNIANCIKENKPLEKKDFCNGAVLNVSTKIPLRISRKAGISKGKVNFDSNKAQRCDLILTPGSVFSCSIFDLIYSVLEKIIYENMSLEKIQKMVIIDKGLMVIPSKVTDKNTDFHTLLYGKRAEINKKKKDLEHNKGEYNEIKKLADTSQLIKIILNAGYGVTAENTRGKAGQFFNPLLACNITGMARLLNNIMEIASKKDGFNIYYTDTDSGIMDYEAGEKVTNLFKNICELKNELEENEFIEKLYIVSAKEYAYFTNNPDHYAVKTHGVGYRGREYEQVLESLFRNLVNNVNVEKAISEATAKAPILRQFNFTHVRAPTKTLYTNLAGIVKQEAIGEYNRFKVYSMNKNDLFITDCEQITKGTFGSMFRLDSPKIYLFSVKYGFNETDLLDIIKNIPGIPEEKRKLILERIENKYSEGLFLNKFLDKNEDNVKRKIDNKTGFTTPYETELHEELNIEFNEKKLSLDGVEYCGIVELPSFDFSSKMEADLQTYYSKSITSIAKSLSYWLAKKNNPETAHEVFNKRNSDLLIPQKKTEIIVPINMVEIPETEEELIKKLIEQKKHTNKKICGCLEYDGEFRLRKDFKDKQTGIIKPEIKDLMLGVLKPRNTIITEIFNNKKYWFEIVSHKSNNSNAILRIDVVVGNPPKLKVYLWINPTPYFNVELWSASYTDLMFSSDSLRNVVREVFNIAFKNEKDTTGIGIMSTFSRGSSLSTEDLAKNNRYFLDICYTTACSFIIMNSMQHISLKIGRLDFTRNFEKEVNKKVEDLVISYVSRQLHKNVEMILQDQYKNDEIKRFKAHEEIYTASGGHYAGMINKKTRISQVVYNKSEQLSYKLIKTSRKKSYNVHMIRQLRNMQDKFKGIWRLEVQAYGYRAIQRVINAYDTLMKKLERTLRSCITIVNEIDYKKFEEIEKLEANSKAFMVWFNDPVYNSREKPPAIEIHA